VKNLHLNLDLLLFLSACRCKSSLIVTFVVWMGYLFFLI
jgi:hypothetical protein